MASSTLNASSNQSFHQRGFLAALNNSSYADRKCSQSNSLARASGSPKRNLLSQLQSQQRLSRQQSKSPICEVLQSQSK